MKLIIDVGVSNEVEKWLAENGHDVKSIRNLNPSMEDKEIIRIALKEKRLLITMDKDFGELVFKSGMDHYGVLLLRLETANSSEKLDVIKNILEHHKEKLLKSFSVYQNNRLRIRKKSTH